MVSSDIQSSLHSGKQVKSLNDARLKFKYVHFHTFYLFLKNKIHYFNKWPRTTTIDTNFLNMAASTKPVKKKLHAFFSSLFKEANLKLFKWYIHFQSPNFRVCSHFQLFLCVTFCSTAFALLHVQFLSSYARYIALWCDKIARDSNLWEAIDF